MVHVYIFTDKGFCR